MLKALEGLQYGFETPKSFQNTVVNHRVLKLSVSKRTKLDSFHTASISALGLDNIDERYLLSASVDGAFCIHDLQNSTGKASYAPKLIGGITRGSRHSHEYCICTVQWYPFDTGMFVTSGMDGKLKIWDTNAMKPADTFNLKFKIKSHHMSPVAMQHSLIALAMDYPHAVLLDPRSGSYCHQLRAHKTALPCIRWSPACEYLLATGGFDSKILLWDIRSALPCIRWSPACEYLLATGGFDSKILLWDIRSAKGYLSSLDQHNGEARGNCKDLITAHNGVVNCLCFTDDGLHLVSFGTDSKVRLWDVALSSNTLVNYGVIQNNFYQQQGTLEVCCNTNPPVIFVPSTNRIIALDLFSGCRILCLKAHFSNVNRCVYRSSTNQLYSGGTDLVILVWTPDSEQEATESAETLNDDKDLRQSDTTDAWSSSDGET